MVIKDLIDCEHNKLLKKSPPSQEAIRNEMNASDHDLDSAIRDFSFDDHKGPPSRLIKADYGLTYDRNTAIDAIDIADRFNKRMKSLVV